MRYMGAIVTPELKQQLLAQASVMPDDEASDIYDVAVATPFGHKAQLLRIGIGAAAGIVVGVIGAKLLSR